jgi:uncharacterized membrane protein YdbT with pleckstrin-like domain
MPIQPALANNTPEATLQPREAVDPERQLRRCAPRAAALTTVICLTATDRYN